MAIRRSNPQDAHYVLHWKKQLNDELGLVFDLKGPSGIREPDKLKGGPMAALKGFLDSSSPKNVAKALAEKTN